MLEREVALLVVVVKVLGGAMDGGSDDARRAGLKRWRRQVDRLGNRLGGSIEV